MPKSFMSVTTILFQRCLLSESMESFHRKYELKSRGVDFTRVLEKASLQTLITAGFDGTG